MYYYTRKYITYDTWLSNIKIRFSITRGIRDWGSEEKVGKYYWLVSFIDILLLIVSIHVILDSTCRAELLRGEDVLRLRRRWPPEIPKCRVQHQFGRTMGVGSAADATSVCFQSEAISEHDQDDHDWGHCQAESEMDTLCRKSNLYRKAKLPFACDPYLWVTSPSLYSFVFLYIYVM